MADTFRGRMITYEITIKHRGVLRELFLERLKKDLWKYFGDIGIDDITIKKRNNKRGVNYDKKPT